MPIQGGFHVEVCSWANDADREAMRTLRETVFVLEQHVPPEMEVDEEDPRSVHALARASDGTPVGTGRLAPGGQIGRMAVLRDWRGRGVGTGLLTTLLDLARMRRLPEVSLHAQREAVPFYRRHGFETAGEEFEEAGIPHVLMRRPLDAMAEPDRPPPPPAPEPVALHAATREELIAVTLQLLSGARHSLCVLVRELHPLLLNDTACVVELRRLAISGRGASIRILAQDLTRALQEGSRVLELAQRLSSVIELRRPVEDNDLAYRSAFMCTDTGGYLFRPQESEMAATGSTYAPGRHVELMGLFEEVWVRSEPWPELRNLGL
ncbi:MAG: Acetyltransferase, GNAT family [Rhodanobacteraceae bacterium]|jgi:predicted GNAT family N-acyltransferase|nr:MAG: Acetyltransferase, GNAT family [Rhodanobacteraceae bacterium]